MDKNQQIVPLARLDKNKDIGVYFDAKLDFKHHIYEKINNTYMMLGLINRNFKQEYGAGHRNLYWITYLQMRKC